MIVPCDRCGAQLGVREIANQLVAAPCSNCGHESLPVTDRQLDALEFQVQQMYRRAGKEQRRG